jgi:hypothetical protein
MVILATDGTGTEASGRDIAATPGAVSLAGVYDRTILGPFFLVPPTVPPLGRSPPTTPPQVSSTVATQGCLGVHPQTVLV